MNEIVVVFGSDRHLTGTLTLPTERALRPIAFLLLNAGVVHRMGPHRFNVKLARSLAQQGIASLRLDLSGQGDSESPARADSFDKQAVADLQAAMDHVERVCGIRQFVVAGICSGAHNGLAAAQRDPRVVGLWMMDGYVYPTARTRLVRSVRQLRVRFFPTLGSWFLSALRFAAGQLTHSFRTPGAFTATDFGHSAPSREAFASCMQSLVDRGVKIFMVYSGSLLWTYNYPEQLQDAFKGYPFVSGVRCDFVPEVDHTATTLASQRQLIGSITGWATSVFVTSGSSA